jgi:hypothetical protein
MTLTKSHYCFSDNYFKVQGFADAQFFCYDFSIKSFGISIARILNFALTYFTEKTVEKE